MVEYNSGPLGTIVGPNNYRYELTWPDMLWFARMLMGEPPPGNHPNEWSALLWCYAQRHAWQRRGRSSSSPWNRYFTGDEANLPAFTQGIRMHSQPINPRWRRDGDKCRNRIGRGNCSEQQLERRDRIFRLEWNEIPLVKRVHLLSWARGEKPNIIPGYVDFIGMKNVAEDGEPPRWRSFRPAGGESSQYIAPGGTQENNFGGRTFVQPKGNVFFKSHRGANRTTNWPPNHVRIIFNGEESQESPPEETPPAAQEGETNRDSGGGNEGRQTREREITSDRRESPSRNLPYFTLESETRDPASNQEPLEVDSPIVKTNEQRFQNQVISMKGVSTLELAQAVPIIEISTVDERGNRVNLNELIFGKSPYNELFLPVENVGGTQFENHPERPIASIQSLQLKVETPTVGGPSSILIGTLTLKIHNPDLVTDEHPRGKFISYMLRQGFSLRIKYGVVGPQYNDRLKNALQWKEQDFFISQHDIVINNDKTYELKMTILPATEKLFNQINIGESIPFEGNGGTEDLQVTNEDVENILRDVAADATPAEKEELRRRLRNFQESFNSGQRSAGYRIVEEQDEQGNIVFGSVLHGAIQQSRILENPPTQQPIPIENAVDALRGIQSIILTRRFEDMLEQDTYRRRRQSDNAEIMSVNMGPLIWRFVKPELDEVARLNATNGIEMGVIHSSDDNEIERRDGEDFPRRSNVKVVFGNFNRRAGNWGDKPISLFPVNVNEVFRGLRREREVGKFSSTINGFMRSINSTISEPENFVLTRENNNPNSENQEPPYRIERPLIKYLFYPDPTDPASWIFLVYDSKQSIVQFRDMMDALEEEHEQGNVPKENIIRRLNQLGIPYLEIGESNSIIKQVTARTTADDLLQAHNIIQANRRAITAREADGTPTIPAGVSREFMGGQQTDPQNIIRATEMIMPVEVTLTTYLMTSAFLFTPVYIFFPTKMFQEMYVPYILDHEVREGMLQTRMTLQINISGRRRRQQAQQASS